MIRSEPNLTGTKTKNAEPEIGRFKVLVRVNYLVPVRRFLASYVAVLDPSRGWMGMGTGYGMGWADRWMETLR